jgi:hypothetical protein
MANMIPKEFLGFAHQNLGVLESQKPNFSKMAGNEELKQKCYGNAVRNYDKCSSFTQRMCLGTLEPRVGLDQLTRCESTLQSCPELKA